MLCCLASKNKIASINPQTHFLLPLSAKIQSIYTHCLCFLIFFSFLNSDLCPHHGYCFFPHLLWFPHCHIKWLLLGPHLTEPLGGIWQSWFLHPSWIFLLFASGKLLLVLHLPHWPHFSLSSTVSSSSSWPPHVAVLQDSFLKIFSVPTSFLGNFIL